MIDVRLKVIAKERSGLQISVRSDWSPPEHRVIVLGTIETGLKLVFTSRELPDSVRCRDKDGGLYLAKSGLSQEPLNHPTHDRVTTGVIGVENGIQYLLLAPVNPPHAWPERTRKNRGPNKKTAIEPVIAPPDLELVKAVREAKVLLNGFVLAGRIKLSVDNGHLVVTTFVEREI